MQPVEDGFGTAGFSAPMKPIGRQNEELSCGNRKLLAVFFHEEFSLVNVNEVKGMGKRPAEMTVATAEGGHENIRYI